MLDNIHKCDQMPKNKRILVTDNKVYLLIFAANDSSLMIANFIRCPYCGCALMEKK